MSKTLLKSTNSIKFPSASCKFWLHWSCSPYKLKYAEYFAFWILEALQKTNTPNFHKFKANYLSKRGLKWLTQILSWFSPKNEGSVAPISICKQKCTQALVTFQYVCSRGLCNISPLSSDGNIFDTEILIHFLWTKYLLIQMLNSNWLPSFIFYLLSAWLYSWKTQFLPTFLSSSSHCINYLLFIIFLLSTKLSVDVIQGFSSFTMSSLARRRSLLNVCIHSPGIF